MMTDLEERQTRQQLSIEKVALTDKPGQSVVPTSKGQHFRSKTPRALDTPKLLWGISHRLRRHGRQPALNRRRFLRGAEGMICEVNVKGGYKTCLGFLPNENSREAFSGAI